MIQMGKCTSVDFGMERCRVFYCNTEFVPESEIRVAAALGDIVVSEIPAQQGKIFAGLPVCSPKILMNLTHRPQIVVLAGDFERVCEKLQTKGFADHVDFTQGRCVYGTKERILFISHELSYTGAPRSLLRMCKVARKLGYEPLVWSRREGDFRKEYEKEGFAVDIVLENEAEEQSRLELLRTCKLVVANTALTYKFVKAYERLLPLVWYIRESKEDIETCLKKTGFLDVIRNTRSLCTVSEYTAEYLKPLSTHAIRIIPNCIEDRKDMAAAYRHGSEDKVKFALFGTICPRKGQDVLLVAYKGLPEKYKNQSEIYFAGQQVLPVFKTYTDKFLRELDGENGAHYLGLIKDEKEKFETLSRMDVVTVLSRDDPNPLSLLEGIMLGRAVLVTDHVGGKYLVNDDNGCIVQAGDVEAARKAMIWFINNRDKLEKMGKQSRQKYEKMANMDYYEKEIEKLYRLEAAVSFQ